MPMSMYEADERADRAGRRREFADIREWGWSKKKEGNRCRVWNGCMLTIFQRGGCFKWCIAARNERRYSPGGFKTEAEAINNLADEMRVGQ